MKMTLTNMKEIAKENNGTIPAGIAMTMTDFEIKKALEHGYLKEEPGKVQPPEPKKGNRKSPAKKESGKTSNNKPASKSSTKSGQAEKKKTAPPDKKEASDKKAPAITPPSAPEFTKEQKDNYTFFDGVIYDRMNDMQKSSFDIAYALHMIYEYGLYKIDGYKNIYNYANERYGIARGTTNNFINIVDRFAVLDKPYFELKSDYSGFNSTQLICMLGHTDDELKDKGINSAMSSREIKKALKDSEISSKGETVNTVNGGKSDVDGLSGNDGSDTADDRQLNELQANIVLELTKESFSSFPNFGSADSDTCVMEVLAQKVKVITKLLLLGHSIQILDIV